MWSDRFRVLLTAVVVPALLMSFAYYGFSTNYTRWVFGEASFRSQYERGIYRYRVLGREGLLATYHLLQRYPPAPPFEKPIAFTGERMPWLDGQGDLLFYHAYFVWNSLGAVLTTLLLALMLRDKALFGLSEPELSLWVLLSAAVIAITQFVISPYDTISEAFLVGGAWASLRALKRASMVNVLLAGAAVILGTLTRETAILNVALVAACAWAWLGWNRKTVAIAALAALPFAVTYLGLRLWLGTEHAVADSFSPLELSRALFNRLGLLTLGCVLLLPFIAGAASRKIYGRFLLFSLPYLLVTLSAGVAWEVRLWVPLFLMVVICFRLSTDAAPKQTFEPGKM